MDAAEKASRTRIRPLIRRLGSKDGAKRLTAEQELLSLGDCFGTALIGELGRVTQNRRAGMVAVIGVLSVEAVVYFALRGTSGVHSILPVVYPTMMACTTALAAVRLRRTSAARILASIDDSRAIGALAGVYVRIRESDVRRLAGEALLRLAPKMRADTASKINEADSAYLRSCLLLANYPLADTLIDMFVRTGDTGAIPPISQLARNPQCLVRAHAAEALKALEPLAVAERQRATLLRPADSGVDDQLLRPAADSATVSPALLLRACKPTP